MDLHAFEGVLHKYGDRVVLHYGDGREERTVRAFVQPIEEKRELQAMPTPLGVRRRDRFLYLGEPDADLEGLEEGFLEWRGKRLELRARQPVYVGEVLSHWWGVLGLRDEEEGEV